MKNILYILTGSERCKIFRNNLTNRFDEIKDEIIRYEFNSKKELNSFKNKLDDEFDEEYIVLTEQQVVFIMEHSRSNKDNLIRNVNNISRN
jgi:predicted transposase YbfD/YdcC